MDAVRKFLASKTKDVPSDLNNSDDVRRVIEKVEVIDSVDVDAIHSQLNEIAEEKAAARRAGEEKKGLQKTPEVKVEKPQKRFPGFEDFQSGIIEKPLAVTSADTNQENVGILGIPPEKSIKVAPVESKESNPYLKNDNFTAFID